MPKKISNESIFTAVIKVVCEKGYPGASTKLMAETAGIGEVTLFRKFGTKAGVVKQAIRHLVESGNRDNAFRYTGDIESDLSRIVQVYLDMVTHYGHFLFVLMAEIPRSDELKGILEIPLELIENFSRLINIYQKEGILIDEPVQNMVSALLGPLMYQGMLFNALKDMDSLKINSREYVGKFLNGRLRG